MYEEIILLMSSLLFVSKAWRSEGIPSSPGHCAMSFLWHLWRKHGHDWFRFKDAASFPQCSKREQQHTVVFGL